MHETSNTPPAVEIVRVSRLYGGFAALSDISLRVRPGAAVLLLGENGAGKSTLLRIIAGLITPSSGTVSVLGAQPHDRRERLAFMSHAPLLYDELTALENLRYFAELYRESHPHLDPERALHDVGLEPALPRRVGDFSQGMRQRASLARALMLEPDLLLLDEPFSNLDAASARQMVDHLRAFLAKPGRDGARRTLFLTTHQADLARPLASSVLQLSRGSLADTHSAHPEPQPPAHHHEPPAANPA